MIWPEYWYGCKICIYWQKTAKERGAMSFKKAVLINIADSHLDQVYWKKIDELVETRVSIGSDDPRLLEELKDADVLLLGFGVAIGKELLDAAPNLKFINILATAYGSVDLTAAAARNIPVCNLGGYSTEAVAEFTIAAILQELRGLAEGAQRASAGNYDFTGIKARELKDSNFGVIGLGNIGNRVAELAAGFGANVSYWSRSQKDTPFSYHANLSDLLAHNDIISVNVAEAEDTIGLLNANNLPLIPSSAILISTVPASVIDTDALAKRLEKNDMTFIFDHPDTMPSKELAKIKDLRSVVAYPAIAFITDEARIAKQKIFVGNMVGYLNGNTENQVN